jgi:hypothetical protein
LQLASREEERLKAEASLLNKFSANGFGIYNIDKLTNAEQLVKLDVHFDFEKELLLSKNPIQLMVVSLFLTLDRIPNFLHRFQMEPMLLLILSLFRPRYHKEIYHLLIKTK